MQALKDNGIAVIAMKEFLAWRQGEKNISPRSCIITIDDGYVSGYSVAWPILKQYGYPFTIFIYTNYVNVGGKSITWAQLEEMRDAGVDIESLTVSHHDRRHAPQGQDYNTWLHNVSAVDSKPDSDDASLLDFLLFERLNQHAIAERFHIDCHRFSILGSGPERCIR